jgi:hypothetical protein
MSPQRLTSQSPRLVPTGLMLYRVPLPLPLRSTLPVMPSPLTNPKPHPPIHLAHNPSEMPVLPPPRRSLLLDLNPPISFHSWSTTVEQPAVSSPRGNVALTSVAVVKMMHRLPSSSESAEPVVLQEEVVAAELVLFREEGVVARREDVVDTQAETNLSRVFQTSFLFSFLTHTAQNHLYHRTP